MKKYNFVFILELIRLFAFAVLIFPLLFLNVNLYKISLLVFFFVEIILLFRKIEFTDEGISIIYYLNFYYNREIIPYKNVSNVIYKYGQFGGMSIIIFKTHQDNKMKQFFSYRFVLENRKKAISLLKFIKDKKISINIDTPAKEDENTLLKLVYNND